MNEIPLGNLASTIASAEQGSPEPSGLWLVAYSEIDTLPQRWFDCGFELTHYQCGRYCAPVAASLSTCFTISGIRSRSFAETRAES